MTGSHSIFSARAKRPVTSWIPIYLSGPTQQDRPTLGSFFYRISIPQPQLSSAQQSILPPKESKWGLLIYIFFWVIPEEQVEAIFTAAVHYFCKTEM